MVRPIIERIRNGMTVDDLDGLIRDEKTPLKVWRNALLGYAKWTKLIKLWKEKRSLSVADQLRKK